MQKISYILEQAEIINNNDNERIFLIYGVCLGYQAIMMHYSNYKLRYDIVNNINRMDRIKLYNSFNKIIEFYDDKSSYIYLKYLLNNNEVYFNHKEGILIETFKEYNLDDNFVILADLNYEDKDIVTLVKHKTLPIIGQQFHLEKTQFENKTGINISKSNNSILISVYFSMLISNIIEKSIHILINNFYENNSFYRTCIESPNKGLYDEVFLCKALN